MQKEIYIVYVRKKKKKYKNKIDITIITLINNGYYESELKKKGIKIFSLGIKKEKKNSRFY